jgi:hypothetical protein
MPVMIYETEDGNRYYKRKGSYFFTHGESSNPANFHPATKADLASVGMTDKIVDTLDVE